ncbi:MAG: hypothetical protein HZC41_05545 [Chloroflexi bacterium]|nr:hypothetical protein [Chloroflexota bacterium]
MKARQKPGVVFQPRVHQSLQRGIAKLVGAIRPTLGPISCGVAIDPLNSAETLPEYLDDGGVIARRIIELSNRDEDMGAMLARSMIIRQHERLGDGTATVAVLFEAIFNAGLRYIAAGGNAVMLRRHLECALPVILDALDRMVTPLAGQAALTKMALTLCHDEEMAALLGEIFDLIGEYGRLEIREDYGRGLRREYVEGTYYYTGLMSRALLPDDAVTTLSFDQPAIFVCDFEVDDHRELFPVLQAAHSSGVRALVIVARNLSEKAVSLLVANNRMDTFKVMAVKLPGLNPTERMEALEDLGRLTGATPVLSVTGDRLDTVTANHFGQARRVWADLRTFTIIGGQGDPRRLREHLQKLQAAYRNAPDVDDRKRVQQRIGTLLGGSVTLWIGGFTEPEINARKSRAERAALALRSAVEGGVVPGAGIALLNCGQLLKQRLAQATDADERAACNILIEALGVPARTILRNAGYDPSAVLADVQYEGPDAAFDVLTDRLVNTREAGILDSVQVLKASVRNAISTAGMALTIDSLVHLSRPEIIGKPE